MPHERRKNNQFEIEETLVINSMNPQIIESQIVKMKSLDNYRLLRNKSVLLHDFYLDTIDHQLKQRRLALRLRQVGSEFLITLKGPPEPIDWNGGIKRFEIEEPWSFATMVMIIDELNDQGVDMQSLNNDQNAKYPLETMMGIGLVVVQDRETQRTVRNIHKIDVDSEIIQAEMMVDSVSYYIRDQVFQHREVEIEAKVGDGSAVLPQVVANLISIYGSSLRHWRYSKLITGLVIEKLLYQSDIGEILKTNNNLTPSNYDSIEKFIKHNKI